MTKNRGTVKWSGASTNGVYWWRYDDSYIPEVVEVRDGQFYSIAEPEPTSIPFGQFLGPVTPEQFTERDQLLAEVARLRALLQPIIDCYGLGQSAEKFTEHVGPFILDARAALSSEKE